MAKFPARVLAGAAIFLDDKESFALNGNVGRHSRGFHASLGEHAGHPVDCRAGAQLDGIAGAGCAQVGVEKIAKQDPDVFVIHIDVDDIRTGIKRQVPHVFDNHCPRHSSSGIEHEVFEQAKFFGRKLNSLAGAFHPAFHPVELQIGNVKH